MSTDIIKNVAVEGGEVDVAGSSTGTPVSLPTGTTTGGNDGGGTAAGPGTAGKSVPYLKFQDLNDRVYRTAIKSNRMTYEPSNENVELVNASWLYRNSTANKWEKIVGSEYGPRTGGPSNAQAPFFQLTYTEASFSLDWFTIDDFGSTLLSNSMALQIDWKMNDLSGSTTSGLFSVIDNNGNVEQHASEVNSDLRKQIANDPILGTGVETTSTSANGAQQTGDGTGGLAPAGTDSPEASGSPTSISSGNKSKSGLSTGAKAGIGVGAALGALLIIGLLVFFLLRRRRQKKELGSGYKTQPSSNTYMVDKETQGRVTESPTSPYTDDNQGQRVPLTDIETTREAPATQAPYEDAPPRSSLGSHGERERGTGTETPQGRPTNVSHLVEDGMTAEEIRRLEEEERQLDDEIERAARR